MQLGSHSIYSSAGGGRSNLTSRADNASLSSAKGYVHYTQGSGEKASFPTVTINSLSYAFHDTTKCNQFCPFGVCVRIKIHISRVHSRPTHGHTYYLPAPAQILKYTCDSQLEHKICTCADYARRNFVQADKEAKTRCSSRRNDLSFLPVAHTAAYIGRSRNKNSQRQKTTTAQHSLRARAHHGGDAATKAQKAKTSTKRKPYNRATTRHAPPARHIGERQISFSHEQGTNPRRSTGTNINEERHHPVLFRACSLVRYLPVGYFTHTL